MPMYKKSLIALLFIAIAVLGGTIYGSVTSDEVTQLDAATTSNTKKMNISNGKNETEETETIFVYVTGAVNNPGMVELPTKKGTLRVDDAVKACGDVTAMADTENFNRAEAISDGQHIHIPEKKSTENTFEEQSVGYNSNEKSTPVNQSAKVSSSNKKSAMNSGIVNINTADSDELQTLNGIGPKMAERIIEYRQSNGPFKSIEEFQNVRGIGPKTFEKLKSQIRI